MSQNLPYIKRKIKRKIKKNCWSTDSFRNITKLGIRKSMKHKKIVLAARERATQWERICYRNVKKEVPNLQNHLPTFQFEQENLGWKSTLHLAIYYISFLEDIFLHGSLP